jgi:branched-chain amino acid aminotransferase group I
MQMRGTKLGDPRNADILVWIGDRLYPREQAKVSVLDSAVQGGDAVWEGIRVYDGRCFKLEEHINRLFDSARAMLFENVPSREFIYNAVFKTLQVNGMRDGVHMRLTLTRGAKLTSSMNPKFNVFGTNLIILPEWKPVGDAATYDNNAGIMLVTATNRRNPPQCVDSKIHHCNLINNILPKIQANNAGAADALMLDTEGFVSETNATNFFMVKHGVLSTPHADYCLPGITRQTVMKIARDLGIPLEERRVSLAEVHAADEAFTTGSMGELTPVVLVDGRRVGNNSDKVDFPIMARISARYREMTNAEGIPIP